MNSCLNIFNSYRIEDDTLNLLTIDPDHGEITVRKQPFNELSSYNFKVVAQDNAIIPKKSEVLVSIFTTIKKEEIWLLNEMKYNSLYLIL